LDSRVLEFSPREARGLLSQRARGARVDVAAAQGWAAGLVLRAERAAAGAPPKGAGPAGSGPARGAAFADLAAPLFQSLAPLEQDALLRLSGLPEVTPDLARGLTTSSSATALLERLHERQLLVTRDGPGAASYQIHGLLRGFLQDRLARGLEAGELGQLRRRAAELLVRAGRAE